MSNDLIQAIGEADGLAAKWRKESGASVNESEDAPSDITSATLSEMIVQESKSADPVPVKTVKECRAFVLAKGVPQTRDELAALEESTVAKGAEGKIVGYLLGGLPMVRFGDHRVVVDGDDLELL